MSIPILKLCTEYGGVYTHFWSKSQSDCGNKSEDMAKMGLVRYELKLVSHGIPLSSRAQLSPHICFWWLMDR